ncbi:ring hydroxylating alpha subunit-domain-containing protein [Aspergillus tetrazonus]
MAESEKSSQKPVDNNTTTILATGDTCTLDQSDSHKAPPVFGSLAMLATCVSLMATWEAICSTMAAGLNSGGPVSLIYGDSGMRVAPTFFFPNTTVTMTSHYFYLMRVNPTSPTTTTLEYEVCRHKDASDQQFGEMDAFFKQVEDEDKQLCEGAQRNLNAGVYVNGELHPAIEKGVIYFKAKVRDALIKHREAEQAEGTDIWPTMAGCKGFRVQGEMECCAGLSRNQDTSLAW